MSTLLIKNIHQLVTCDDEDRVLHNAVLYCEDGFIKAIGTALDISADEVIDGRHMLCYPGLVNTHHHLYQVFSRNLPQVQNMELFDWLKTLYEIWKNLDEDVIRLAVLDVFALRPAAIISVLHLRSPLYADTSAYGHFNGYNYSWENLDKTDELRKAVEKYAD